MSALSGRTARTYDRIIESCLIAILIYTPLALGGNRLWAITPVYVVTLAALCAFFLKMNAQDSPSFRWTPLAAPIFAFLALAAGSSFFSAYPHDSVLAVYRLMAYAAIYYIIVNTVDSRAKMERLTGIIIATGALLSFIGLIIGHVYYKYWIPGDTLSSTYMNRDHFAGYLEMALPLTASLLFTDIDKTKKVLAGFLFIMMLVAFVLAASRGAWVSLTASCCLLIPFLFRKKVLKRILLVIIICGIIAIFALSHFDLSLVAGRALTIVMGVGIDDVRMQIWLGAIELIKASPLIGTGIGSFVCVYPRATVRPSGLYSYSLIDYAHNDYLHMTVELGFVGLFIMLWLIACAVWSGMREFWTSQGSFKGSIVLGATIGIMSMALHSFVDFNLHIPANAILFVVLIAIIMTMRGRGRYD